ncbi:WD40 repeat domain-containing protein [Planctomicrobium piriforme]|uniref:WD40 repeat domain-containing protein n=1 Tax=Planctomicrobium piriforme TaxID=1576369 RepID=UPI0015872DB1|nr:hypothetical protein [Planctomicrobium piriforme]
MKIEELGLVDDENELYRQVNQLLLDRQYEQLETLAQKYRDEKSQTQLEVSKLDLFYISLTSPTRGQSQSYRQAVEDRVSQLETWVSERPSYTAQVALGWGLSDVAWAARGGGLADTITNEASRAMDDACDRAELVLQEAASHRVQDAARPWAEMTLGNLRSYSPQRMRKLMKEVSTINPWNRSAIGALVNYSLPRWHGEPGGLVTLADDLARDQQQETGEFNYALVADLAYEYGEFRRFSKDGFDWKRVRQGYLDWARHSPDLPIIWGKLAFYARIADDRETARDAFQRLQGVYSEGCWETKDRFQQCLAWAFDDGQPGQAECIIELGGEHPTSVSFANHGRQVLPYIESTWVSRYSPQTGKLIKEDRIWPNRFSGLTADSLGKYMFLALSRPSDGGFNIVRIDAADTELKLVGSTDDSFQALTASPTGNAVAMIAEGGQIRLWDLTSEPTPSLTVINDVGKDSQSLAISPDGKFVASARGQTVTVWDVKSRKALRTWNTLGNPVYGVRWAPDGKSIASFGWHPSVQIWNPDNGQQIAELKGDHDGYFCGEFTPDSQLFITGTFSYARPNPPGEVIVFDLGQNTIRARYQGHRMSICGMAVSAEGNRFATASDDGSIRVWAVPTK